MKSQDILLLFKLASLDRWAARARLRLEEAPPPPYLDPSWQDWEDMEAEIPQELRSAHEAEARAMANRLSVRGLAAETGISKSEVSQSLKRCLFAGLAIIDRKSALPKANIHALREFVVHGLRYVFPVRPAEIARGIATGHAAPVLQGRLMSAGEFAPVWPDPRGNSQGQAVAPLFKSVPFAVRKDPQLYEYLALADAIRLGQPRERKLAAELLERSLEPIK